MLNPVGAVAEHARDNDLAVRELHVLERVVVVHVPEVHHLERHRLGVDLEHRLNEIPQLQVVDVRALIDAVAGVVADFLSGDVPERVVDELDPLLDAPGPLRRLRVGVTPQLGGRRIVELDEEAGVDDRSVLLVHRVGERGQELVPGGVILVPLLCQPCWHGSGHERLGVLLPGKRGLQVGDVGRQRLLPDVANRRAAHQPSLRAQHGPEHRDPEVAVVVVRELADLRPRLHPGPGLVVKERLESADPLRQVGGEPALALLAVIDDVEAGLDLTSHTVLDGGGDARLELVAVVRQAVFLGAHQIDEVVRPGDAAGVRREDAICAGLHRQALSRPVAPCNPTQTADRQDRRP